MRFFSAFFTLAAIVSSVLASPIEVIETRSDMPPPNDVFIKNIQYSGSGCPPGSIEISMTADRTVVQILFSKYAAQIGPKIQPIETRKNCLLNFNILFPQGWAYTIFRTEYTGYVSLDAKVQGLLKTEYWFTGSPQHRFFAPTPWVGPYSDDYSLVDNIPQASFVWSPCGFTSTLNANTQVRLDKLPGAAAAASGQITVDAIGQRVIHKVHLAWKKNACK